METSSDWSKAISHYGSSVTYKTAGLAVLLLVEQYGQAKVIDYFKELGQGVEPPKAFQQAFGISIEKFTSTYINLDKIS